MFFRFISCFLPSLLFFSIQVHAANSSCISAAQVRNVSLSFKFVPTNLIPQTKLCDPHADSYQLASILLSLKDLRLDPAPLSGRYDQKILGNNFWEYLTTRIKVISKADESSPSCRSGAMAYVEPEIRDTLFLCPSYFADKYYSPYGKATILLHEARHIEGYPHELCLAGNKVGATGGCDERIDDRGSYAVSTEALAKILFRGQNVSPSEKKRLKIQLLESLESFNEPVNGIGNTALYLIDETENRAYFFDGLQLYPTKHFEQAHVVSRFVNLQILPKNKMKAFSWDVLQSESSFSPAAGACAQSYNAQPAPKRSRLLEVIDDGIYFACVYEDHLSARIGFEMTEDLVIELPFKAKTVFSSDEVMDPERNSYYAISTENEFYRIRFLENQKVSITQVADPTGGFRHLFFFNSDLTGLSNKGVLLKLDFDTQEWVPFPALEGRRFKSSTRPFLWSRDFLGL